MNAYENQRESFRLEEEFEAELFYEGRVVPCTVVNLSAGGALVQTGLEMQTGAQCTLGLKLEDGLTATTKLPYVSFHMEILEQRAVRGGELNVRLRNLTASGSKAYEQAQKLVFEAQRRSRAKASGTDEASPMATDGGRRKKLGKRGLARFSKGSMRPGSK